MIIHVLFHVQRSVETHPTDCTLKLNVGVELLNYVISAGLSPKGEEKNTNIYIKPSREDGVDLEALSTLKHEFESDAKKSFEG